MQFTEEYRTEDKTEWGDGPWNDEPDKAVWVDEATGLDCMVRRGGGGALCGYVGVPLTHPWYGQGYQAVDVSVHGGLTYADSCEVGGRDHAEAICHIAQPGRPDNVWWFGFDMSHAWDFRPASAAREKAYMPAHLQSRRGPQCVYRDFAYVVGEVEQLAQQLAAASA